MRRRIGLTAAALATVAVATGCGSTGTPAAGGGSSASSGPAGTAGTAGPAVTVRNFTFMPRNLTVPVSTTVTWTFADSAVHNASAADGSFRSENLKGGQTYKFTFTKAGTYQYICTIHQFMTGTITVK
ncbi:MAG TPA: cupredoxin family copper-binding protein [Mycobacteriales bacterium]|nr:cupredoxin family copper-binding protein [Mycobacteriales bacterium]